MIKAIIQKHISNNKIRMIKNIIIIKISVNRGLQLPLIIAIAVNILEKTVIPFYEEPADIFTKLY